MLRRTGAGLIVGTIAPGATAAPPQGAEPDKRPSLALSDYEPKSMLQVRETRVERSRYPVIDFHTHITVSAREVNGVALAAERNYLSDPGELIAVMDRKNIRTMVNLTGGFDAGLVETVRRYDKAHPGRFYTLTEPCYSRFLEPGYPQIQAEAIEQAHRDGARGLKILKTLGLYLRDNITSGKLVKIDDPRFDPMWDICGQLQMPVAIHISDPVAFFLPTDRFNERYEELSNHPDWSFHDHDFPSNAELIEARNRVFARHPKTHFVGLHVGNFAEDLENVSENLDRFPNLSVDIAARVGELGRQPRTARAFFEKYQDRILFGTDATPHVDDLPQQLFNDQLYEIYFRFLETSDEYFDYAPAKVPPQGRWRIYGIDLPDQILRKVYQENAARALKLSIAPSTPV
ncbi:MAG: amidohydrolase family protein [Terracidiphilus sp.]|nr:amidohydrolase family protein [Terracidiphilus sp.]MDR3797655.1 amidohydrolase family protein [Terracidiphilus sp.]